MPTMPKLSGDEPNEPVEKITTQVVTDDLLEAEKDGVISVSTSVDDEFDNG